MEIIDALRQLLHPSAFRIRRGLTEADLYPLLDQLVLAAGNLSESGAPLRRPAPSPAPVLRDEHAGVLKMDGTELIKFLADLGTGLWRLRQKLTDPESGQPLDETRRAWRYFESVWDLLDNVGLEVKDHTGTPYHAGSSLHVIAFQPTDGVSVERIVETIRPSIYLQKRPLQMGEVIVAVPPKSGEP